MSEETTPPAPPGGVFISHSSRDGRMAQTITSALERRGIRCWISSRDIGPGENFQEAIVHAIRGARVMVLVFTGNANNSNEIKKEMALAGQHNLTVIPVRVEDVLPNDAFTYEFATRQWIDAFENWDQAVDRLSQQINMVLGSANATSMPAPARPSTNRTGLIAAAVVALIVVAGGGAYAVLGHTASPPAQTAAAPPLAPPQPPAANAVTPAPAPPPAQQALATPPSPAPAPQAALAPGKIFRDCADCPEMVVMPTGDFMMGDDQGPRDERPAHKVRVTQPFAIGRFDVTRAEFARFVATLNRTPTGCDARKGSTWASDPDLSWRDPGFPQTGRDPVVCVGFKGALAYAAWLSKVTGHGYRLPTEAEWEFAARGGTTTRFYWGDDESRICQYENDADQSLQQQLDRSRPLPCSDGYAFTSPVGSYQPNPFGLYDMLGDVFQWVADCWQPSYEQGPADAAITSAAAGDACERVARGGNWLADGIRASFRLHDESGRRGTIIGFRVARALN